MDVTDKAVPNGEQEPMTTWNCLFVFQTTFLIKAVGMQLPPFLLPTLRRSQFNYLLHSHRSTGIDMNSIFFFVHLLSTLGHFTSRTETNSYCKLMCRVNASFLCVLQWNAKMAQHCNAHFTIPFICMFKKKHLAFQFHFYGRYSFCLYPFRKQWSVYLSGWSGKMLFAGAHNQN